MLREFKEVSQPRETPGYRRWFSDAEMELIVWFSPAGVIRGFQLRYDRNGYERAFTWHVDIGMVHTAVDEGDSDSPILVPDGIPRTDRALAQFRERARSLEPEIVSVVIDRLEAFRRARATPP